CTSWPAARDPGCSTTPSALLSPRPRSYSQRHAMIVGGMPVFESRWDDAHAAGLDEVDRLAYRSNLLGADERIVNRGGGNTSTKHTAVDYRGRELPALAIKASGYDLKTAPRAAFPDVALDAIAQVRSRDAMSDEDMVDYL